MIQLNLIKGGVVFVLAFHITCIMYYALTFNSNSDLLFMFYHIILLTVSSVFAYYSTYLK